jgi:DNA invertase Pin-like site-specific DNA recombinase
VSSKDQSPERQIAEADTLGILPECRFIEQASGKDFARPEYQLMKRMLCPGDLLYITSLDWLGRNKQMILDEWQELTKVKQVDIAVLDMPLLNTAGIVNSFTVIDEFSPQWELFRAISTKNGVKLPEKEDLFPTWRGK